MKTIESLTEAEIAQLPKLPERWKWAKFEEITENFDGKRKPLSSKFRESFKGKYPYYGACDIIDYVREYIFDGEYLLIGEDGANLLSKAKPLAFSVKGKFWVNNHAHILKATNGVNQKYLEFQFNALQINKYVTGTAQPKLNQSNLNKISIAICPLPEQRAIVSKIEQLFSELDNGISNLKLAQEQLKVYRQAVLKKAFEGELTIEWRKSNSLLYEWESKQLNEIAKFIDYRGKTPQKTDYGVPLITAKNVRMGFINEEPREFIAESDYDRWMTRGIPKKGDVLFTTEAPLGYVAQLNTDKKIALAQRLITLQPVKIVTSEHLKYYLMSPKFQTKLHLNSTGTTVKGIKAATLKRLPVDIPSFAEQQAIVQEIETRLSVCDKIEQDIKENLEKAEALRQSILKKAFEGKLLNERELAEVRKAEDWEPAEVLLEKIKALKEGKGKKGKQPTEKLKSVILDDRELTQQYTLEAFEQATAQVAAQVTEQVTEQVDK